MKIQGIQKILEKKATDGISFIKTDIMESVDSEGKFINKLKQK